MAGSQHDFKWFGEGFEGFPKSLPEDCIEYSVYAFDATLSDSDVRERLRQAQNAVSQMTKRLLKDFLWQRECFDLLLKREKGRSFLHGRTKFGDSTDDEWTIIYLLRELSSQFPDLWFRAVDTDGEFLLIEAANALPIWLNPEVADFRVWIHDGKLLLVPLDKAGRTRSRLDENTDNLDLDQAAEWIQDPNRRLIHSKKIEQEAFFRLKKYPEQIEESLHQSLVIVPRRLAYVLHHHPKAVSAAIEAFYLRDAISLENLQKAESDDYVFAPTDFVSISTRFTKVSYAQLRSQQFHMPSNLEAELSQETTEKLRARSEAGIKLLCGFEMLMSDPQNKDKPVVREINLLLEDLASGEVQVPTDTEIDAWSHRDDDDSWLDIDYNDFERELSGQQSQREDSEAPPNSAQSHLRKTVQRFEEMLAHKTDAGSTDLIDDMDEDDDTTDDNSEDSENDEISGPEGASTHLAEDNFTKMMQELMGMPPDVMKEVRNNPNIGKAGTIRQPETDLLKEGGG